MSTLPLSGIAFSEVVVRHRCGHTVAELSGGPEESADRIRIAAMFDCIACYFHRFMTFWSKGNKGPTDI